MCDKAEQEKCTLEFGDNLDWSCANCPKMRMSDLHPYTHKLLSVYTLQRAGYPMEAGDLEYAEWLDLGRLRQIIEAKQIGCPMMGTGKKNGDG